MCHGLPLDYFGSKVTAPQALFGPFVGKHYSKADWEAPVELPLEDTSRASGFKRGVISSAAKMGLNTISDAVQCAMAYLSITLDRKSPLHRLYLVHLFGTTAIGRHE
jgi:hypothetical protein